MKVNFWYAGSLDLAYHNHTPTSILKGLKALGAEINHCSQNGFRKQDFMECDFQVIYGMRIHGKNIIDAYLEKGINSIVIDLGYIKRAMRSNGYNGFWQVSLNGLNWIPDQADDKRFKELDIEYPQYKNRDGYVLICEQTPGDSSHGMHINELNAWMKKAEKRCKDLGLEYKKRHHPMNEMAPERPSSSIEEDLKDALCVYNHNSNSGNDALLQGIPVVCDEDVLYKPTYYNIVSKDLSDIYYPENIQDYLNRLAYGQWRREEIETGKVIKYVIQRM